MNNSLYFNLNSGVSGDMLIGSLIDLGADIEILKKTLIKIDKGLSIKTKNVLRGLNHCKLVEPIIPKKLDKSFNWDELRRFAEYIKDEVFVYENLIQTIDLIKKCESDVHGSDETKPHELGNFDTVFDIVCFYKCIEILNIKNLYHSGVPFSQGEIKISHGIVTSLAPVSLNIIKKLGIPIYTTMKNPNFEMCTPTGLSLLKNFNHNESISGTIQAIGYGAGNKDFDSSSNSISVSWITSNDIDNLKIIETNIDDMSAEYVPYVFEKILDSGANDVWSQNILMKKGRPAFKISILCHENLVRDIINILKNETSTFGVRIYDTGREAFERKIESISTKYGDINVKLKLDSNEIIGVFPEYEDCKNLAKVHNIPLKVIFDEALKQFNNLPR